MYLFNVKMRTRQGLASEAVMSEERAGQSDSDGYHHGNLRAALLDAVGEIIAEKGIGGVSIREAARRAGCLLYTSPSPRDS